MNPHPSIDVVLILAVLSISGVAIGQQAVGATVPPGIVRQVKILPDQAPDCSSLESIAESVTRGCRNNDERAIAVYNFMQLTHYHRQYPNEPGGLPVLKEIHCYGWSLCGGLQAEQSAIWRKLGWDWRFVGWDGHTTVEAQYDGRWHYLDVFLKFYAWMPDGKGGRTIAGEDDLNTDARALIQDAFLLDEGRRCVYRKDNPLVLNGIKANWRAPVFLACGDTLADVVGGLKTHSGRDHSEGWAGIEHADGGYCAEVNLAPGFSLQNTWDPMPEAWYWAGQKLAPSHTCPGHKDTCNDPGFGLILEPYIDSKPARSYGNGILTFAPDFSNDAFLRSFVSMENVKYDGKALVPAQAGRPAAVVLSLASPYILTEARGEASGADRVEVSVDGGKTFEAADLKDFSAAVKGHLGALVKVTFKGALTALRFEAIVQNNPGALPYLSPGKNVVTISVADPKTLGDNKLVVTYAYRLGSRAKSFEQLCEQGKEIARQHDAKWSDTVTCARRDFTAKDLPTTLEIDCPTPKDRYPVYPRMMFLRREVVAPGSAPLPLPAGVAEPRVRPDEELKALPNPFLVGCNAIRTSHNPPAPELLEVCDRLGMVVMDEAFDCWARQKTPNDYHLLFSDWHEKDVRMLVRRDRNHPCVILWSIGNDIPEQGSAAGVQIGAELAGIVHSEDPTRPVTAACDNLNAAFNGFQKVVDVFGYNYKPKGYARAREMNPDLPLFGSETASTVSSRGVYTFPVAGQEGVIISMGRGRRGGNTNAPAGPPPGLDVPAHQVSSYDLSYATAAVTDESGVAVPRSKNHIRFEIEGPAELVATDNGDATSFEPFQAPEHDAFNGFALAIVRAKPGQAGTIKLTAKSDGLKTASATIRASLAD